MALKNGVGKNNITVRCMDVSENSGAPKSSILIEFSIINHPFWGTNIFGNTRIRPSNIPNLNCLSDKLLYTFMFLVSTLC